nr:MAG TPA: G Protein-Coupled Receptor Kinase [Caudoviricetes sp.]
MSTGLPSAISIPTDAPPPPQPAKQSIINCFCIRHHLAFLFLRICK